MKPSSVLQRLMKKKRAQRGMTLIEIMVVIAILAVMFGAAAVALVPKINEARVETARNDIATIQGAMKLYYAKKGKYPDTSQGIKALVDTQNLEKMPKDPWGNDYVYMNEGGKPLIKSYGADKQEGGEGSDADISSADSAAR